MVPHWVPQSSRSLILRTSRLDYDADGAREGRPEILRLVAVRMDWTFRTAL
jgi:hypothetical protein